MTGCGHGHVYPEPNGLKARCGGPKLCSLCANDQALKIEVARWEATAELRWFMPPDDKPKRLQQRWQRGAVVEWRDVPVVQA